MLLVIPMYLSGQDSTIVSKLPEIGIVERLDTYMPGDIVLMGESGTTVLLDSLVDKPTVLAFVYYRCPGICTPLMDGLADVINKASIEIGTDYQIITVSFNPREGYELASRKKKNYMNMVTVEGAEDGWKFFVTDSLNIQRLTSSAGFYYKRVGNDFLHTATLVFLDKDRKITRYLNGTRFLPFEFKMAVLETSKGQSGPTINKILQYCYAYDPQGQAYVLNITRVSGIFIMMIMFTIFIILTIKPIARKIKERHQTN